MASAELAPDKKPRREVRPPVHLYTDHLDADMASPPRSGTTGNHDYCDACGDGGSLLCCDECPCSFHLMCVDPPLKAVPPGDWFCNQCRPKDPDTITPSLIGNRFFSSLLHRLRTTNPHAFRLSSELVASVTREEDGPRSNAVSSSDSESATRPPTNGLMRVPKERRKRVVRDTHMCRICGQTDSPLLRCVRCQRAYHLYCLDPPLIAMPSRAWFCPEHPGYMQQRTHVLGERTVSLSFQPVGNRVDRRKAFPHRAPKPMPAATDDADNESAPSSPAPKRAAKPKKPAASEKVKTKEKEKEKEKEKDVDMDDDEDNDVDSEEEKKSMSSAVKDAEYLLALQNLQKQLEATPHIATYPEGESFLARARANARQKAYEEQALEAMRLKALEEALLPAAFPTWVAMAEHDAVSVPPSIVTHLSPLFVQFLAWQRLCEVSQQLAALPTALPPPPAVSASGVPRKQPLPAPAADVTDHGHSRDHTPMHPPAPKRHKSTLATTVASETHTALSVPPPATAASSTAALTSDEKTLSYSAISPTTPAPASATLPAQQPPSQPSHEAASTRAAASPSAAVAAPSTPSTPVTPLASPPPAPLPKSVVKLPAKPMAKPHSPRVITSATTTNTQSWPKPPAKAMPATYSNSTNDSVNAAQAALNMFAPAPTSGEKAFRLTTHDAQWTWTFSPNPTRPTVEIGRRRTDSGGVGQVPAVLHVNLQDVPGNSLVSRHQASVAWNAAAKVHMLTNHGRNGTTVGTERLNGETSGALKDGTTIRMGRIGLRYQLVRPDGSFAPFVPFTPEQDGPLTPAATV